MITTTDSPPAGRRFDQDCREAVLRLRGSLLNLYHAVGADSAKPQEVSRRFKLGKNLTWKVARIIQAEDALTAVPLIPGVGGLEILLSAMGDAGAPPELVEQVREASRAFDSMIEIHVGDRATLELILDSMGSSEEKPMSMSRKLAYRGNSGIWGIQADVRVTTFFVSPNRTNADKLDIGMVGGFTGMRRLRPVERWPIFRLTTHGVDHSAAEGGASPRDAEVGRVPIDPDASGDPWLIESMCSGAMPEVAVTRTGGALLYEIGDGPIGRLGEFSCFFGFLDRASVVRYRDEHNTMGEFFSSVSMPAKTLLLDAIVHRDVAEAMLPEVSVLGHAGTGVLSMDRALPIPLPEQMTNLGTATMVKTPLVPDYDRLVDTVMTRAGWDARDFVCLRLVMPYPPMPATVALRYPLPERQ